MPQRIKTDPKTWSSPGPTAPCIESRVPIFAPILRVSHNSKSREKRYETPWGWVELEGPVLTQEHRTILDMAMAMAVKKQVFQETGGMGIWFDQFVYYELSVLPFSFPPSFGENACALPHRCISVLVPS